MNRYDSCQDELIMFSYLCGTVYIALACLVTGDLQQGVVFMHHQVTGTGGARPLCVPPLSLVAIATSNDVMCKP